jgi:XrtJ-associated TM-motif-TM protein
LRINYRFSAFFLVTASPESSYDGHSRFDFVPQGFYMIRRCSPLFLLLLTFAVALPLHAQSGCTDSPEAPTVVLALVGGLGALSMRFRRK